MHLAALNGHRDTLELLATLDKTLITAVNNAGSTPLHYASMMGRVDSMKFLLEQGSDVSAVNSTGSTPLHAASLNGYGEAMELLIDQGADINYKNKYGYSPLTYADSNSRGHSPIYNSPETLDESDIYG